MQMREGVKVFQKLVHKVNLFNCEIAGAKYVIITMLRKPGWWVLLYQVECSVFSFAYSLVLKMPHSIANILVIECHDVMY